MHIAAYQVLSAKQHSRSGSSSESSEHNSEDKDVIKKLEKTRVEKKVDLAKAGWMVVLSTSGDAAIRCVEEKEQRDSEERARRRKIIEVGLDQESTTKDIFGIVFYDIICSSGIM